MYRDVTEDFFNDKMLFLRFLSVSIYNVNENDPFWDSAWILPTS